LGTARRKGRQQTTRTYDHRATSRLYLSHCVQQRELRHSGRSGIPRAGKRLFTKAYGTRWIIALEARYNHGYTEFVKTAISIPDSLFEEADRLAKTRGWSRSELYANAVTAYVNSERFSGVREKLDAVYGNDEEDSAIDPFLADAQARSLPREKW
jgi:hypothetical protein